MESFQMWLKLKSLAAWESTFVKKIKFQMVFTMQGAIHAIEIALYTKLTVTEVVTILNKTVRWDLALK